MLRRHLAQRPFHSPQISRPLARRQGKKEIGPAR
jgi:hypothetical protein